MSLFSKSASFLTLRPHIREEYPKLIITQNKLSSAVSLKIKPSRVTLDVSSRTVLFENPKGSNGFSDIELSFDDLYYLDYTYKSIPTSFGWSLAGFGRKDEVEVFSIVLADKQRGKYPVCTFSGEGTGMTGWTGVLLGEDSVMDLHGTQESESRTFVNYLKEILNIPIGLPVLDETPMKECPGCGRKVGIHAPKCVYCASTF